MRQIELFRFRCHFVLFAFLLFAFSFFVDSPQWMGKNVGKLKNEIFLHTHWTREASNFLFTVVFENVHIELELETCEWECLFANSIFQVKAIILHLFDDTMIIIRLTFFLIASFAGLKFIEFYLCLATLLSVVQFHYFSRKKKQIKNGDSRINRESPRRVERKKCFRCSVMFIMCLCGCENLFCLRFWKHLSASLLISARDRATNERKATEKLFSLAFGRSYFFLSCCFSSSLLSFLYFCTSAQHLFIVVVSICFCDVIFSHFFFPFFLCHSYVSFVLQDARMYERRKIKRQKLNS